jgi:catalase
VPGIDFTADPLLQGRLHSYLDTQLSRLGSANFHEIPINRPVCPMRNFQRDGHMRMEAVPGRVNYEPNSLGPDTPRENPLKGFASFPDPDAGPKTRSRPETFADHYSQGRQFWKSMSPPEQSHIVSAFTFELSKVETPAIRTRMLGHLDLLSPELGRRVAKAMGMEGMADRITPAVVPRDDLKPSPALSLVKKWPNTIAGRTVGVLITDGFDSRLVASLQAALKKEGADLKLVAPHIGPVADSAGKKVDPDMQLDGAPSVIFDAVVAAPSKAGADELVGNAASVDWLRDAFGHLKVIGCVAEAQPLLDKAGVAVDARIGVLKVEGKTGIDSFIEMARKHRIWDREPLVRPAR